MYHSAVSHEFQGNESNLLVWNMSDTKTSSKEQVLQEVEASLIWSMSN